MYICHILLHISGADPGFQVRGGALREAQKLLGYFVWKITILCQKIIFFPILGGAHARCSSSSGMTFDEGLSNIIMTYRGRSRGGAHARCTPPPLDLPLYVIIMLLSPSSKVIPELLELFMTSKLTWTYSLIDVTTHFVVIGYY